MCIVPVMPTAKKSTLNIGTFPQAAKDKLDALAADRGLSLAAYVRMVLIEHAKQTKPGSR